MPRTSRKGRKVYRGGQQQLVEPWRTSDPNKTVIFSIDYIKQVPLDQTKEMPRPTSAIPVVFWPAYGTEGATFHLMTNST